MEPIPEDVLSFLCAIAFLDVSGVALALIQKYRPELLADFKREDD